MQIKLEQNSVNPGLSGGDRGVAFVAIRQITNVNINEDHKPQGFALLFHPDLIKNYLFPALVAASMIN
jgi:hypothetical protein